LKERNLFCKYYGNCKKFDQAAKEDRRDFSCLECEHYNTRVAIQETEPCGLLGYMLLLGKVFLPETFKRYQKEVRTENKNETPQKSNEYGGKCENDGREPKEQTIKKRPFLTINQAAWELKQSERSIRRLIADGFLLAFPVRPGGAIRIFRESYENHIRNMAEKYQADEGIIPITEKK